MASCALVLVSGLMMATAAWAGDPPSEPASDSLATRTGSGELPSEVADSAAKSKDGSGAQSSANEVPLAEEPAPSSTGSEPSDASSGPAASTAAASDISDRQPAEDESSYDEELADFVAKSSAIGSSYDRAYATTASEQLRVEDDSMDPYRNEAKKNDQGIGLQLRRSRLSKRLQEIFVERSAGPAKQTGFGVSYVNRSDAVEFSVGLGYDPLDGVDRYYVERGGSATRAGDVDYIDFRDLSWVTLDVNAIGVVEMHDAIAFRFGAGLGAGVLLGQLRKTDSLCTSDRFDRDCAPDPNGAQMDDKANIPPIVPVINALVGIQGRPSKDITINLDAGIHSVPYVAIGVEFFLW